MQLQQYFSDGSWRNAGTATTSRVSSGGGSGKRTTDRADCTNSSTTTWRSVVDVDLVGLVDDTSVLVTPAQNVACRRL